MVESAFAQSILKPSVPEFTLKYIHNSYDVAPTYGIDPYTGKNVVTQAGYHVENKSIEITIRNQPFTLIKVDNEHYADFFYNISYKGHYGEDWQYYSYDLNTEWFLRQSDSEYTVISFKQIPSDGQIDFRVQAQIGYFTYYYMPWKVYDFTGETSGWSNTQTITISDGSTSTTTPNPTSSSNPTITPTLTPTSTPTSPANANPDSISMPLSTLLVVGVVFVVIIASLLLLLYRRPRNT